MIKAMNLIFIYGPPASGKLTIAEELASQTDYKLFHNHLTQDLAKEIYPEFDETRFGLVDKIRLDVFEYAALCDTNLIFTFVYVGDEADDEFIADTIKAVTKHDGKVFFVEISAPADVLLARVNNESRQRFHKLKDPVVLEEKLKANRYQASVQSSEIYKLDSSRQTPNESAGFIREHYKI